MVELAAERIEPFGMEGQHIVAEPLVMLQGLARSPMEEKECSYSILAKKAQKKGDVH